MSALRVRIYNVRFGDAILITIPDRPKNKKTVVRNILIDVGNATSTKGGIDALFEPVAEDILKELNGKPLDLYIMTHEHMDHVQGLPYAEDRLSLKGKGSLKDRLAVQYAWMTASSDPDYGNHYPNAREKKILAATMMADIQKLMGAAPQIAPAWVRGLMAINSRKTDECVNYLRGLHPAPSYVHRETPLAGLHPFHEARLELWAPEADTSVYYGRFQPLMLGGYSLDATQPQEIGTTTFPPAGVDASTFYNLVQIRQGGFADNLLAIDKAANNTSVVLCLEWGGWRLLFPADAELRSWQEMDKRGLLKPVDFLKVGHHGSHNATPPVELLDKILPLDGKKRLAAVSTYPAPDSPQSEFVYNNVPDGNTLSELVKRARVDSTFGLPDGSYIDYLFSGGKKRQVVVSRPQGS